jgi:Leucine-rich repeat (LRR) protein
MPDKFDNLPHLSALYLDQNQMTGQIPATLQNSSLISSIHLSNNTLDGMLYFPNAYNLTQLYASRNQFTYLNIDSNTALVKLVLDDNAFNCTLPDVQSFTDLQTFSVARNGFTGEIFDVTNLAKLVKL